MSQQSILVCIEILCEVTNTNTTELSIIGVEGDREAEREKGRAGAAMATMAAMISMIRVPCSTPRPSSAVAATESSRFCAVSALAQRAGTRTGASRNWIHMNKVPHFWCEKTQEEEVREKGASASAFGADPWGLCGSRLPPLLLRKSSKPSLLLCRAAAADAGGAEGEDKAEVVPASESGVEKAKGFSERFPTLVTGFFFFMWYFLNVVFNILNKKIYNYFPYPYFVSVIHLAVGVLYCLVSWTVGLPKRAPISKELFLLLLPVSFCHSLGHVMTNVSFATVAVSFTHTIKALEPFFNAAASQFVLGQTISLPLWLSLAPVVLGVSMASLTELSFNWTGFISAMVSNIAFTYRSVYSKKAMTDMDSTNVYAYISILSVFMCLPPAIIIEGPKLLQYGFTDAIAKVGMNKFLSDLFWVGMFYHLYNQLANNTLERVAPLSHAVGNVLKRVFVIGFSIVVFGNKISTQTAIGTTIAIAGVAVYSFIKAKMEEEKLKAKSA